MSPKKAADSRTRILSVTARNVKKIRQVSIDEMGDIVEIRGDADQGKTSILDAIQGGLEGLDKDMVRRGADKAEIELVLSDATVQRIIGAGDGKETLMVTGADGKAIDKAKDFLRTICGRSTFRPLAWVQLGAGEKKGKTERVRLQRDQLLESLDVSLSAPKLVDIVTSELGEDYVAALDQVNLDGINFEAHPFVVCRAFRDRVADFRTMKNAERDRAEEILRATPAPAIIAPKAPEGELRAALDESIRAYHEAGTLARSSEALRGRRDQLAAAVATGAATLPDVEKVEKTEGHYAQVRDDLTTLITDLETQIAQARQNLSKAHEALDKCAGARRQIAAHEAHEADLAAVEAQLATADAGQDIEALRKAMDDAAQRLEARRLQDKHDTASAAASAAGEIAKQYDDLVKLFRDGIPKHLLSEANLPVPGLSVDDEQILIDDVPLHQLGTSKQIRLGVLIAHALNPRSAFVLVDGAESMGKADRVALAETARELGLQLIMTFVDPEAIPAPGVTVMREGVAV